MKEPSTDSLIEDVEALPDILSALNRSGRIDIVTDWLAEKGIGGREVGLDASARARIVFAEASIVSRRTLWFATVEYRSEAC